MGKNRFDFGRNWKSFLDTLDEERINEAERSLSEWLGMKNLTGKTFLDIGSGSGLFSLAAKKKGAVVHSFDYDPESVNCTKMLKRRFYPGDKNWTVEQGDVLDQEYLRKYGKHDIVYSWGVLHHTGSMYKALDNAGSLVKDKGKLFIAIYNDQGRISDFWKIEKRIFNKSCGLIKLIMTGIFFVLLWTERSLVDLIRLKPFERYKTYYKKRGMSPWHDSVDWMGGFPFEVAKPEEIIDFYRQRGFELEKLSTCGGGNACNQYVFLKK